MNTYNMEILIYVIWRVIFDKILMNIVVYNITLQQFTNATLLVHTFVTVNNDIVTNIHMTFNGTNVTNTFL